MVELLVMDSSLYYYNFLPAPHHEGVRNQDRRAGRHRQAKGRYYNDESSSRKRGRRTSKPAGFPLPPPPPTPE